MWICPACEEILEYVKFGVSVTGTDYGTVDLISSPPIDTARERNYVHEHTYNTDNSESGDWDGTPWYECPQCNENFNLTDLIWKTEKKEKKEIIPPKNPNIAEELTHPIIHPTTILNIEQSWQRNHTSTIIICKHCFFPYPFDKEDEEKTLFSCPKCEKTTGYIEYLALVDAGFYSRKTKLIRIKETKKCRLSQKSLTSK